jgi:hypothetical protein
MDSANPYAPPTALDAPPVQEKFRWYLAGRGLYLRDGAVLPKIELETGDSGNHLIEVSNHFSKPRWQVSLIVGLLPMLILFLFRRPEGMPLPYQPLLLTLGTMFAARLLITRFRPDIYWRRIGFKTYRSASNERMRKQRDFWNTLLSYSPPLIAAGIFSLLVDYMEYFGIGLIAFGSIGLFIRYLWKRKSALKIRPAEGLNGWIRVSEIHPLAMQRLLEAERSRGR